MIPGALRRGIAGYDKQTLKKTSTVDKSSVQYQQVSKDKSRHGTPEEWSALQNKIFTRWVNQKLARRFIKIDSVTTALRDSVNLIHLLEILSETKCDKKLEPTTVRVKQIDNANRALEFMKKVEVKMTLSPSPENIVDGNEKIILGMLWAIMSKFLKIGDDDDLNAQDALLMWMQNQVNEYKGVHVDNLTTSFHDGLAFCALIHKFRPKLLNFDALDPRNGEQNLQTAFDAAEQFFGLEQYLKPSDILKLDDKSMAVILAEFYHGIGEERRLDTAARSIAKVIRFTVTNDSLKKEYNEKSLALKKSLAELKPQLEKLTEIDNTMAGAKSRLNEFTNYKTKSKGELLSSFLYLESLFTLIARRLSDGKRPEFIPAEGGDVKSLAATLKQTEEKESQLQVSLHEELNRQIKLANINQQHTTKTEDLRKWSGEKKIYLSTKEEVKSVGSANYHLNVLGAYETEFKGIQAIFGDLKEVGNGLEKETFEDLKTVRAREDTINKLFEELNTLNTNKRAFLEDDLARETLAERVTEWDKDHQRKFDKLQAFVKEKKTYLQEKEDIKSVSDAKLQLEILDAYESEKKHIFEGNVPALQKLGGEIRGAKYESKYSVWMLPELIKVQKRDMGIDAAFQELDLLSSQKLKVLKDDLAREEFREGLNRSNEEHIDNFNMLQKWVEEKAAYLKVVEEIKSSTDAEMHLGFLTAYSNERQLTYQASVPPLKSLGAEITTNEYKSSLSSYRFPTPQEVITREETVEKAFVELDKSHAVKLKKLTDDLKREEFREKVELWNQKHIDKYQKISAFANTSGRYLKKKEGVNSIADAQLNLARLGQYSDEQKDNDTKFKDLQKLGGEIREAKYETDLSSYTFPGQQDVLDREENVRTTFKDLSELHAKKKAILDDDLERELFREKLRQWNLNHVGKHKKLREFIVASKVYLGKKEAVYSIADAQLNLARLQEYEGDKKTWDLKLDNFLALGQDIKTAEYKTEFSSFTFKTPEEIDSRENETKKEFDQLAQLGKNKGDILGDDLAREEFREKLRQWNLKHTEKANKLHEFVHASKTYLITKDEATSIAQTELNLSRFREYLDERKVYDKKYDDMKEFGAELKAATYQTKLSSYKYPQPEEIDRREHEVTDAFKELSELATKKHDTLKDDQAREEFKEKLRQWNQDHIDKFNAIEAFITSSRKYLKAKESVGSISEAQVNLERLQAYFSEKSDFDIKVQSLKALGNKIKFAEHYTQYKWPNPKEIDNREGNIDVSFVELDLLSGEKDTGDVKGKKKAEELEAILGEVDDDDQDEHEGGETSLESKERAARRKAVRAAAALMSKGEYKAFTKLGVLKDDLAREQFKQKLRRWNKQHADSQKALHQWFTQQKAYLEKKESVESIASAGANLTRLRAYETGKNNCVNVNLAAFKKLGNEVLEAEFKTTWSQWKWETPDEVKTREQDVLKLFELLEKLAGSKRAVLEDDLAREEFREKLRLAAGSHLEIFENIKTWAANMKEILTKTEAVNSILDANNNLAGLNAALEDKKDATNMNVASLKNKGAEILSAQYKTELSSYVFADPGVIKSREFAVDEEWHNLDTLAAKKREVLDADLKRELLKESLRLNFANTAREFNLFAQETIKEAKLSHFGFNLPEVKAAGVVVEKAEKTHAQRAEKDKAAYEKLHKELTELGVTENVYTTFTPETLNNTQADLQKALQTRKETYNKELKRQEDNDALCVAFAEKAKSLANRIKDTREAIITSTKDLETQLKDVQTGEAEIKSSTDKKDAEEIQAKVDAAGVTHNSHTVLTMADLEVSLKQYEHFLATKRDVLEKAVEHKKLRGITPQQYNEIHRQFETFDRDHNKQLDRFEFKACLYSLGEDLGKKQIHDIMDKYSGKTNADFLTYEQFREWMINYFGVLDTKEDVRTAFHMISFDEKSVRTKDFEPRRMAVLTPEDLAFFKTIAPKTEGRAESWDYNPFLDEVFSR